MLLITPKTLARGFDAAGTEYLRNAAAVVAVPPFTMACWFNKQETTVSRRLMCLSNIAVADEHHSLLAGAAAELTARSVTVAGNANSSTTALYGANRWHHAAGVFASAASRIAYLDGVASVENTTSRVLTANATLLGVLETSAGFSASMNGQIVWPAFWKVALTAAEIALLKAGTPPALVRPESLVAFWDWKGNRSEVDVRGAFLLTNTGTVPVDGPGFLQISLPRRLKIPAAMVGKPDHYYRTMRNI